MRYHAHVYWNDAEQLAFALNMRTGLEMLGCELGHIRDLPVGPHTMAMYQAAYDDSIKASVEKMLAGESHGISILLHDDTGDDIRDHTTGARWINDPVPLDIGWLEEHAKGRE